jgi:uncharacterized protein (TIGR01244 family)
MKFKNRFQSLLAIALMLVLISGGVAAESYLSRSLQVDDWYIGPQPSVTDLEEMKSRGVGLVISTRRPGEMEQLGFDESQEARARGMEHLNIAVGGTEYPFVPAMLETFTQAVDASEGPILMHCRSGYRVSVLAAAYLVKEQGVSVDAAIEKIGNQRVTADTVKLLLTN